MCERVMVATDYDTVVKHIIIIHTWLQFNFNKFSSTYTNMPFDVIQIKINHIQSTQA